MKNFDFFLDRLSCFAGVDLLCIACGRFWDYREYVNYNPVRENAEFREFLIQAARKQEVPLLFLDSHDVVFSCVRQQLGQEQDAWFFLGPMALKYKSRVELHSFYRDYGMKKGTENPLPVLHLSKILELTELTAGILTEQEYEDEVLIKSNGLDVRMERLLEEEQNRFRVSNDFMPHHSYEEERRILNAVKEGRTEDAVQLSMVIDSSAGLMSKKEILQWQKLATVSIALCTRAAIEGGISPAEAYRISDFFTQKCDTCRNAGELLDCRNLAIRELTEQVRRLRERKPDSSYVELCRDYIGKHYREKIRLKDIADSLGLNPSYLSRVFSVEMGIEMQEYIVMERVERASNLLLYSDLTISAIGDYAGFSSQSYFGKMFKRYKGMSPGRYRSRYRPKEFIAADTGEKCTF